MRDPDICGEFSETEMSITLRAKMSLKDAETTLLHEILHAALYLTGSKWLIPQIDRIDLEECVVMSIEHALAGLVTFNDRYSKILKRYYK